MFRIQIDFDAELTKIHSRTLTDAFRHSTNGPEFQLWPALSLPCYLGIQAKNSSYLVNRKKKSCIIFSTFLCENAELGMYDLTLIYVYV